MFITIEMNVFLTSPDIIDLSSLVIAVENINPISRERLLKGMYVI
jgi:hypothetical protein